MIIVIAAAFFKWKIPGINQTIQYIHKIVLIVTSVFYF